MTRKWPFGLDDSTAPSQAAPVVRGVVVAVYFSDGQQDREAAVRQRDPKGAGYPIRHVAADVLTYGGRFRTFLAKVPIVPRRHALNDYDGLWIPRAATVDLATGGAPILRTTDGVVSDPRDLDGDHVLVEFLENDPSQPFIRDELPHPRAKYVQVKAAGDAVESRFRGVVTRIDTDGNVVLDTTRANSGAVAPGPGPTAGDETPAADAAHGRVTLRMNAAAPFTLEGVAAGGGGETFKIDIDPATKRFRLRLDAGAALEITDRDGNAVAVVGDGAIKAVREDLLNTLWGQLKTHIDGHTHAEAALRAALNAAGVDPTLVSLAPLAAASLVTAALTVPTAPSTPAPAWDAAIGSNKLKFPAG